MSHCCELQMSFVKSDIIRNDTNSQPNSIATKSGHRRVRKDKGIQNCHPILQGCNSRPEITAIMFVENYLNSLAKLLGYSARCSFFSAAEARTVKLREMAYSLHLQLS